MVEFGSECAACPQKVPGPGGPHGESEDKPRVVPALSASPLETSENSVPLPGFLGQTSFGMHSRTPRLVLSHDPDKCVLLKPAARPVPRWPRIPWPGHLEFIGLAS